VPSLGAGVEGTNEENRLGRKAIGSPMKPRGSGPVAAMRGRDKAELIRMGDGSKRAGS